MEPSDLDKKFYKISDVAEILNIPASTLRFWESKFTVIKPHRNSKMTRFYTPSDIETIRLVYYLVKEKGMKLTAAKAEIKRNRTNVSQRLNVINKLKDIKKELLLLQEAMTQLQ